MRSQLVRNASRYDPKEKRPGEVYRLKPKGYGPKSVRGYYRPYIYDGKGKYGGNPFIMTQTFDHDQLPAK